MRDKPFDDTIPSLYEWMGGSERLTLLFSKFYEKVMNDVMLSAVFKNMSEAHVKHVAYFIAEVFRGPKLYTEGEVHKSHADMVEHHIGKKLTEPMRKRWIELLLETADEINLADDPEFRSALVGYLEWGSRLAVLNSQSNNNPIEKHEPMPVWGWGETGGPYQGKKE